MSVSTALEKSVKDFCSKYACKFDFATFESKIEEFTFLRPVGGWIDVYKTTFDRLYKNTLEQVALGSVDNDLDPEAMLDDFEYTLIRPYVNESEKDIKHKPYVGMDRISRIAYLEQLTKEAPSNFVDLYADKYKRGELSLKEMMSASTLDRAERRDFLEVAGYAQALEAVNQSRSPAWRAFHPFKNGAEKRSIAHIKRSVVADGQESGDFYREVTAEAYKPFDSYQKINANLEMSMKDAKEERDREQKMNDVMRESIRIESFEKESGRDFSPRVEHYKIATKEKQI